jgi:hypothetical protein
MTIAAGGFDGLQSLDSVRKLLAFFYIPTYGNVNFRSWLPRLD